MKTNQIPLKQRLFNAIYILSLGILFIVFLYPLLHESGHLLAAKIFGGQIGGMSLNLLNARAFFCGNFTNIQNAIIFISGMAFPYFIWLIFIIIIPKFTPPAVEYIKLFSSLMIISTMLPYLIMPIVYLYGKAPSIDDSTRFIFNININPVVISIIFLIIITLSLILFLSKTKDIKELFYKKIF
jgi:hypothetical protein